MIDKRCKKAIAEAMAFLFHKKFRFYGTKNAPRGSHCGGVKDGA
ncbi:hypothetical protein RUMHYD_00577, partial [Blautia hydrogenotrophica DSM 10507]